MYAGRTIMGRMKFGDCYKAAADWIIDNRHGVLCHGTAIGRGPIEGVAHGHAWVETDDGAFVIDPSNGREAFVPKPLYYNLGLIDPDLVVRYPAREAIQMLLHHEHYGPWHDERGVLVIDGAPGTLTNEQKGTQP